MEFDLNIVLLGLTTGIFFGAKWLQQRTGIMLLNPILITIALIIFLLKCFDIDYETYHKSGYLIEFWLKPAVVALGVPLYMQLEQIKRQLVPILMSQLAGCVIGIVSVVGIASALGASKEVIISLAPKSVTTPIAMEVSSALGGIPALTAAVVVCVGIFGALCGHMLLKMGWVRTPIGRGLAMGTASHAVGTSAAMEWSQHFGAYAGLGLTLNGLLTSALTPPLLQLMGVI